MADEWDDLVPTLPAPAKAKYADPVEASHGDKAKTNGLTENRRQTFGNDNKENEKQGDDHNRRKYGSEGSESTSDWRSKPSEEKSTEVEAKTDDRARYLSEGDSESKGGFSRRRYGGGDNEDGDKGGRSRFGGGDNDDKGGFSRRRYGGDDGGENKGGFSRRRYGDDNNDDKKEGSGGFSRRRYGGDGDDEKKESSGGFSRRRYGGDGDGDGEDKGNFSRRRFGGDGDGDGEKNGFRRRGRNDEDGENGGEGSGRRGRNDETGGKDRNDVPREVYIPPEPTEDEQEMYSGGIKTGLNFEKYNDIPVRVSELVAHPLYSFGDAGLRELVMANIKKYGYEKPTPIQKYAIPTILKGSDLMGCAQTGSGKTAAFFIPIVNKLLEDVTFEVGKPKALVVAPTRELVIQLFNEARKFAHGSCVKVAIAYGGAAVRYQNENLAKGCHILVATPGRLLDFMDRGWVTFEHIKFLVLDEADRMLDMGFKPAMEKLVNHETMVKTGERQTLMFSATFPEDVQLCAGQFLNNYAFISVGIVGSACQDVLQTFLEVPQKSKRKQIMEILADSDPKGTMIFCETKRNTDFLASFLSETKIPTTSIHGDREQRERELAIKDFTSGKMKVLVATSVAARGLDIKGVNHVINFDLPQNIDDYVHRIGRTGRLGNQGKATSFFDPEKDTALAPKLVDILEQAKVPIPSFLSSYSGTNAGKSAYGADDIRNNNADKPSNPQPLEKEEDWEY
uniref:RNA helicase n=1 Tax=Forcipomyia taiwana TaxID=515531 RepID=A0A2R3ZDC2_FORTA|nr:DEAD box protein Vasa [Forcipomyia taiwana]